MRRCPVFDREILRHLPQLRSYAMHLTGDADEADDLLQETYLPALERWEQLEDWLEAGAWLTAIARNLWIDRCRRRSRRQAHIMLAGDLSEIREPLEHAPASRALSQGRIPPAVELALGDPLEGW